MAVIRRYASPMTDELKFPEDWPKSVWTPEEWHIAMIQRLDKWLLHSRPKPPLLKFMHMSKDGFLYWRENRIVPRETRLLYTIFPEFLHE